jgi:riboflavin biosynthesis pyrimidine reductase
MIPRLEVLFDAVPGASVAEYGGNPRWSGVAANFVESVDGVVALPDAGGESGAVVSGGSRADHFVMGLLRACADAVLIGAGTLRAAPRDLWYADAIFPEAAELYARVGALRPPLYVVSGSGGVDSAHPALQQGGVVLTGLHTPRQIVDRVRADGHQRILCEGGPGLFAELAAADLVDELFFTLSPRLFGRFAGDGRKSLTDARDLRGTPLQLVSARRHESHLFLRYGARPKDHV